MNPCKKYCFYLNDEPDPFGKKKVYAFDKNWGN